jgi:hypothetical protein
MLTKRKEIVSKAKLLEGDFVSKLNYPFYVSGLLTQEIDFGRVLSGKYNERDILKQLKKSLLVNPT